jgi:hypothetical protein
MHLICRWRPPFYVFILCFVLGCVSKQAPPRSESEISAARQDDAVYLSALFSELSPDQIDEMKGMRQQVPLPQAVPYENNEKREVYIEWYQTGYAYGLVTGSQVKRDQVWRGDLPGVERAKMRGWFDGGEAGGLAYELKAIQTAVYSTTNQAAGETTVPMPPKKE